MKITYEKENGGISERDVSPLGYNFANNCVVVVDLTDSEILEEHMQELQYLRNQYMQKVYDLGFKYSIRQFKVEGIK